LAAENLPAGVLTNLISQGIIPGIGGILIFIPQIAFLFMFISILEESGYMSRVVFLMDKIMRKFGLSGGAAYFWNCLCYSCYNGHKKHRKLERTTDNNFSNSFHDLFRSTACLRNYNCLSNSDERLFVS
jgi:hypothetical protein